MPSSEEPVPALSTFFHTHPSTAIFSTSSISIFLSRSPGLSTPTPSSSTHTPTLPVPPSWEPSAVEVFCKLSPAATASGTGPKTTAPAAGFWQDVEEACDEEVMEGEDGMEDGVDSVVEPGGMEDIEGRSSSLL